MSFWNKSKKRVFLDYASITPVDKMVAGVMRDVEEKTWANPSAIYSEGLEAKEVLKTSRQKIASVLNAQSKEIFFTGSGTESNNLAILGVVRAYKTMDFKPHIIVTKIEHPSILEVCKEIESWGGEVTYLDVGKDGVVNPSNVASALKENTVLVSIMYANNEIGTIQPIHDTGRRIKDWRQKKNTPLPYFHTDACQGGTLVLNVQKLGVDMLTLDGIKMYGPRGIGMLYVKSDVKISPVIFGGGQEDGLRSSTENLPAIAGLAKAMEIADKMRDSESARLTVLRDYAIEKILVIFPEAALNGSKENRLSNNINICFPGLDAEFAVVSLDVFGISCSHSSSCRTLKENSSSYVVSAIGKPDCSLSSLRFTLGRESKKSDIDQLLLALKKIVK